MSRSAGAERHRRATLPLLAAVLLSAAAARAQDAGQPVQEASGEAMRAQRAEAQAGDRDASFALGVAYDLGEGVPRDPGLACRYYAEAGERGHVAGAFNTAVMYDSGQCGGARRPDLAAVWYGRAAAAGAARAQFNLALLYASGDGVPRNPAVAASWFQVAASSGITAAAGRGGRAPRGSEGQGPLLPVSPAFPAPGQPLARADAATLVWTAPLQPGPVRFFLEVYALKASGPVELTGRYTDVTSARVDLPADSTQFTWRVLTVSASPARYAVGPWGDFVAPPAASEQH